MEEIEWIQLCRQCGAQVGEPHTTLCTIGGPMIVDVSQAKPFVPEERLEELKQKHKELQEMVHFYKIPPQRRPQ